VPDFDAF